MPFAIDKLTRNKIFSHGLLEKSHLDPYLKWTPFIAALGLNVTANKRKHSFKTWLLIIAICEGIQAATTEKLKKKPEGIKTPAIIKYTIISLRTHSHQFCRCRAFAK